MDLFANRFNHKFPLYVSPASDNQACVVDILSMNWNNLYAYAFLLTLLISSNLTRILKYRRRIYSSSLASTSLVFRGYTGTSTLERHYNMVLYNAETIITRLVCGSHFYTPDIRSMWGYIVFAFPFVRSFVRTFVRSYVRSFVRSSFYHKVKVFALKFIRPHILKTL